MFRNFKIYKFTKHAAAVGLKSNYDFVQTKDAFTQSPPPIEYFNEKKYHTSCCLFIV